MSFGLGPFGFSFSGLATPEIPALPQGQLVSSRNIDANGRFVQVADSTGAFAPMSDTMQRAYLLMAYNVTIPDRLDSAFSSDIDSRIRKALEPITTGDEPKAEIVSISAGNDGRVTAYVGVNLRDMKTGRTQVIPARTR